MNVIQFQPKGAISSKGLLIKFEDIDKAFMSGQLDHRDLCIILKRWPHFHRWFIFKHRQVWV